LTASPTRRSSCQGAPALTYEAGWL
jgi:hypothetical protein